MQFKHCFVMNNENYSMASYGKKKKNSTNFVRNLKVFQTRIFLDKWKKIHIYIYNDTFKILYGKKYHYF